MLLACSKWHTQEFQLSQEEVLRFELAINPDLLLSLPIWLEGWSSPFPAGFDDVQGFSEILLPPDFQRVGMSVSLNRVHFVVTAVEADRVWLRRQNGS